MAMIKCPECGKEVSENAAKCPGCGYPIKSEKKKEKKMKEEKIECPECHEEVDAKSTVCPYCGNPLKNKIQLFIVKAQEFLHKKVGKATVIGVILLIVVGTVIFQFSQKTIFDEYTKYLGKNANDLPKSFVHDRVFSDEDYYEATPENDIVIYDVKGEMTYNYSKAENAGKEMKNVIETIGWHSDNVKYSNSDVNQFVKNLEKEYGDYDSKEIEEMHWVDDTEDLPRRLTYTWEDVKGMTIVLSVDEEYEDEYDWEYEDEDKIKSFDGIHLWWSLEEDE